MSRMILNSRPAPEVLLWTHVMSCSGLMGTLRSRSLIWETTWLKMKTLCTPHAQRLVSGEFSRGHPLESTLNPLGLPHSPERPLLRPLCVCVGGVTWAERSSSALYTSVIHLTHCRDFSRASNKARRKKWNWLFPKLLRHLVGTSWSHCGGCGRWIGITLPGSRWQEPRFRIGVLTDAGQSTVRGKGCGWG